jgi:hypothetical protein
MAVLNVFEDVVCTCLLTISGFLIDAEDDDLPNNYHSSMYYQMCSYGYGDAA